MNKFTVVRWSKNMVLSGVVVNIKKKDFLLSPNISSFTYI